MSAHASFLVDQSGGLSPCCMNISLWLYSKGLISGFEVPSAFASSLQLWGERNDSSAVIC